MGSEITIEPGQAEIVIRVPIDAAKRALGEVTSWPGAPCGLWLPRRKVIAAIEQSEQQEIDAEQSARRNP